MSNDKLIERLKKLKRNHYECEDSWYSCPMSSEGCANESEGDECTCGAESLNKEIDDCCSAIQHQQEQIAELVEVIKNIKQGADYYMSDGFECAEDAYRYPGIVQTDCARALAKHQTQEEGK